MLRFIVLLLLAGVVIANQISNIDEALNKQIQETIAGLKQNIPKVPQDLGNLSKSELVDVGNILKAEANAGHVNNINNLSSKIMIFVSMSMPDKSLQQWALQASRVGAPLVLVGFVNNSLKATIKAADRVFGKQISGGFSIDPELFSKYGISKVPAIVVDTPECMEHGCIPQFDVVYGDIGLTDALQILQNKADKRHYRFITDNIAKL